MRTPVAILLLASLGAGAAPAASAQVPLDVMTFNIRTASGRDGDNAWPHRKELVVATLERFAPQVVGLQEALDEQIEYLDAMLPDYRWLGIDRGLNGGVGLSEATPIFYRYDELSPIESGNFWLTSTPDTPPLRRDGGRRRGAVAVSSPGPASTIGQPAGRSTSSIRTSHSAGASRSSTPPI